MIESATALDAGLGVAEARLAGLRRDIAELRDRAGELRGQGMQLVAVDLGRALAALGSANVALQRARRETALDYLTKEEAAKMARLSVRTIERAIRAGTLCAGGSPGRVRIRRESVDEWLGRRDGRMRGPAARPSRPDPGNRQPPDSA